MDRTTTEKIRLGIFVILGTVLIILAAYLIGNRQNMFGKTFILDTVFKNVNGLEKGNNVRYSGINVGTVKTIVMENDTAIRVSMLIEDNMLGHIRKDAIATIGSDGLVGSMIINIVPGLGEEPLVTTGDQIRSLTKTATADMLSTLNVTNENAAQLTADLLQVTDALKNGKGTFGSLLNDTLMAQDLKLTIYNLKSASGQANKTIASLNGFVQDLRFQKSVAGMILNDSITANRFEHIVNNLEASSNHIASMTHTLDTLVTDIALGEGAFNYLTTDTSFVRRLDASMKNIQEGTERFNVNMEALKHNFLTRGYFRKLERQQRKEKQKE